MTDLQELRDLYDRLLLAPHPRSRDQTADAALEDFRVDLEIYESEVAGAISWLVSRKVLPGEYTDLLDFDEGIVRRLEELATWLGPDEREQLDSYFQHLAFLRTLLATARRVHEAAGG